MIVNFQLSPSYSDGKNKTRSYDSKRYNIVCPRSRCSSNVSLEGVRQSDTRLPLSSIDSFKRGITEELRGSLTNRYFDVSTVPCVVLAAGNVKTIL